MFEPGFFPEYRYSIPDTLIANIPAAKRDESRLFVVESLTGETRDSKFSALGEFLPAGALLVFNETRVVPARANLTKDTGGEIEALFLIDRGVENGEIGILSSRKLVVGRGRTLHFESGEALEIVRQEENVFVLKPLFSPENLEPLLERFGRIPLPPYMGESPLSEAERRERYQTVFAKNAGSAAAPTASLHFTQEVFADLDRRGFQTAFIELRVGLGTFGPMKPEYIASGKLHAERYRVSEETAKKIAEARAAGRPVVAVGTTVVRTLESAADEILAGRACSGDTDIFIRPPHEFRLVDALITNFHVPESSLMCLVDAFLGWKRGPRRIMELYAEAIEKRYRFFSFGDSMLIR